MIEEKEIKSAYEKNEISANKHMTFALLYTAGLLFLVWFGYIFKLFSTSEDTRILTIWVIPFVFVLLVIPMAFIKSSFLASNKYKYFALSLFVIAISTLNVIMSKHAILGWAVCIILTGHYYNPKVTRIMFVTVLLMIFVCLGFAMFFGEFDANLLSGELKEEDQMIYNFQLLPKIYPDTMEGRTEYLIDLMEVGENRFVSVFTNYYLGRALFTTVIFVITVFLNKRTRYLLNSEITVQSENQKNKTELDLAKGIQLNTLPVETVNSDAVEIVGELKAAKEVGGDLYDYIELDENHVAILIGDVSGKGVPAAMFMMKTITSFRDFASPGKSPSQILREVNASIYKGNRTSLFVTCFLAILDKRNGKVVYSNAGHNPPLIGHNKAFRYLKCKPGFLLGCFKDCFCQDEELTLEPGDSITLYTDGVTEARDIKGDFFGEERFLKAVNQHEYTCIVEMHHTIKDEIAAFVKDAPQSDDITILTLKYRGSNYTYEEKEFDAKKENVLDMLGFISNFADDHQFPEDFKNKLVIVGDELFSNIIRYGYENNGGSIFVRLLFDESQNEFAMTIIDKAKAFNQLEVNNKEVSGDVKELKVGGLGLIIVKKIMDEYAYDRINDKNILMLKKRF